MLVLFVAFAIYGIYGLSPKQLIYNAFFLISARSAIAPAVGASVLTNWLYRYNKRISAYYRKVWICKTNWHQASLQHL